MDGQSSSCLKLITNLQEAQQVRFSVLPLLHLVINFCYFFDYVCFWGYVFVHFPFADAPAIWSIWLKGKRTEKNEKVNFRDIFYRKIGKFCVWKLEKNHHFLRIVTLHLLTWGLGISWGILILFMGSSACFTLSVILVQLRCEIYKVNVEFRLSIRN